MARIVIGGIVDCPIFAHVDFIAHHMAATMPDFQVKKYMFKESEYEAWLGEVNEKNGWHHRASPIVWKEPSMHGGAPRLMGGANDFWEYCYEYYGILSDLSRDHMAKLALDNLQKLLISEGKDRDVRMKYDITRICISGAAHPMARLLISDLLRIPDLPKKDGVVLFLYDSINKRQKLTSLKEDVANIGAHAGLGASIIVDTLSRGLHSCDLFIILDDYPRLPNEDLEDWLDRNRLAMMEIAAELNSHAPKHCRVVLATPGAAPLCFNATVLIEVASKIHRDDIVAVTADMGLESLPTLSKITGIPLRYLGGSPVWGFVGVNKFVDLHGTFQTAVVYRPNGKSVKKPVPNSTLPLGKYHMEIRKIGYLLKDIPDLWLRVQRQRDETERFLGRNLIYSKVRATTDMLRFWYSSNYNGEVISLGVCSNGTFQLPWGMNFSQPAYLEDGHWVPCKEYPLPFDPYCDLRYLIPLAGSILKYFNIGHSYRADWVLTKEERIAKMQAVLMAKQLRLFEDRREVEDIRQLEHEREAELERKMQKYNEDLALEVEKGERYLVVEHTVEALVKIAFDICLPYPLPPVKEPPKKKVDALSVVTEGEEVEEEEEDEEEEEEGEDDDDDD